MGLGYDPDAKTFTLNDERWTDMIKANRSWSSSDINPCNSRGELDNLFITNKQPGRMHGHQLGRLVNLMLRIHE